LVRVAFALAIFKIIVRPEAALEALAIVAYSKTICVFGIAHAPAFGGIELLVLRTRQAIPVITCSSFYANAVA
jgi:hypothetical protein